MHPFAAPAPTVADDPADRLDGAPAAAPDDATSDDATSDDATSDVPFDVPFDEPLRVLVRTAAVLAVGDDAAVRAAAVEAARACDPVWVEEVILQTYLFAGFPRALNAMREWRRASGRPAPAADPDATLDGADGWTARGEATCATVYGPFYAKLRPNIAALHPALDAWMIVEGYGKVLGRPALPLAVRELCVVAACAASRQQRQLHSHLHGALHAGAPAAHVAAALDAVADLLAPDERADAARLWAHVQATQAHAGASTAARARA